MLPTGCAESYKEHEKGCVPTATATVTHPLSIIGLHMNYGCLKPELGAEVAGGVRCFNLCDILGCAGSHERAACGTTFGTEVD